MKQDIENIIKKNLPEKLGGHRDEDKRIYAGGFDDALSQINTPLIADEVLKVVVEKIINGNYWDFMDKEVFNEELRKLLK